MKRKLLAAVAAIALTLGPVQNAHAIFGLGDIVYDPANHAENILTAARTLQQINNQVQQLANEAQMLAHQAQNLTRLPNSVAPNLQASLARLDNLIIIARGIAYQVSIIDSEYRRLFPEQYAAAVSTPQIIADARESWSLAREGFKHSLEVQAEVVGQVRADTVTLDGLIAESQGAVGNLQVAQAGNQLTALAAKQTMQLQTLLAASARADALERARSLAAHEQARARFARFMGDGDAYTRR
ncbi:conjugal transfer protein TrbJ [Iodidimonas nitroreducens]|uniref:Conjugal transfer protein TrbJ n=1 Tax=Iodidimonas nitroreducens TaxID=1236968 RepID=A0A5A7ND21_9PROT|nr:P-type conjugative transfer protein TrbJ [Iodidimonas nitroreducens]PKP78212.1 MAG: P-type conjugative transfer protein TrbJ [Alphaproteobacteria bacterium HGW-Alphaproteobacteria-3]GAK33907.1 conjugal transfer protein TrbJ [alpha proteobacterium Q-1]GER05624.1 conjugal transfer protein TrbJ [Iodidimonas nitroreducens]